MGLEKKSFKFILNEYNFVKKIKKKKGLRFISKKKLYILQLQVDLITFFFIIHWTVINLKS